MCWHPLETDLRSAGDQLVHYRPDFQREILSSAGGIGTDGGERRPGITTDYMVVYVHGGVRTSLMCWSAIRMAVSSAVKTDTGGKEKDFLRLWNSGMSKAAPAEPS